MCGGESVASNSNGGTALSSNQATNALASEKKVAQLMKNINVQSALQQFMKGSKGDSEGDSLADQISGLGEGGEGENSEAMNEAANKCMAKCESLPDADKEVCETKCNCTTQYSSNGIFGSKTCKISVKKEQVAKSDKELKTIEEIIDEINKVVIAMRDSGQLMKHIKPKEFLDTGLYKLKMNKLVSYDVNLAFKPMYDSDAQKEVVDENIQKTKSQNDAITDRARAGNYDNNI